MKRIHAVLKWFKDIRVDITELLMVANDTKAIAEDTNRIARMNDERLTALELRFRDVSPESLVVDRDTLRSLGGVRLLSDTRRVLESRDAELARVERLKKAARAAEGVS